MNPTSVTATNSNNDFAWLNPDIGVFQFVDAQGNAVDAAAGAAYEAVEFHPKICLRSPDCGGLATAGVTGNRRPLELRTTVYWRNRPAASADDDPCNTDVTTDDPPATIANPDWPDQSPQSIPNPDACISA